MQTEELLKLLNEKGVRYIVVGAFAAAAHGHLRSTNNLNLWVNPVEENMARAKEALSLFGYDLTDTSPQKMMRENTKLTNYWMDAVIHPEIGGIRFETVWKNKMVQAVNRVPVPFAALDDLIRMKRNKKRKIDKEDLKALLALRKKK